MRVLAVTNMLPLPTSPRAGTFVEQQIEGLRRVGVEVEVVLVDRATGGPFAYRRAREALRRALAGASCDLVHVMYGGVLADRATRACGAIPTVVSFCGVDLLGADYGSLAYRARTALGVRASFRASHRADWIVVKSRNLERGLPSGIDRGIVTILPNGVDLDRFQPLDRESCRDDLGWSPQGFHVLHSTSNRRDSKKRLDLAEAAVSRLRAGGVAAEIHGLHAVPHPLVPVWLNAADVLLFTSRADEGSPNIVKEALACGRPVISVDVGDVAERLAGVAGCHIAEPDAGALAAKLRLVVAGERTSDGRRAMQELTIERVAERLVGVYANAVSSFRRGRRGHRSGSAAPAGEPSTAPEGAALG